MIRCFFKRVWGARPAGRSGALAALALLAAWAGPEGARAELLSHRAAYTFKLDSSRSGSDVVNVNGVMRLAMEQTCDGWIMGQDVDMNLNTAMGDAISNRLLFAAWESVSGLEYDFVVRNKYGESSENVRGHASISSRSEDGVADFREPEGRTFPLPPETLFPIQHLAWLIAEAEAGKNQVSRMVFDGTDVDGPQQTVTFIGGRLAPDAGMVKRLGQLVDRSGWNMRIAYFDLGRTDGAPAIEIEIYQLENGVSPKLLLDYGTFTAVVEMVSIETIAPPSCS